MICRALAVTAVEDSHGAFALLGSGHSKPNIEIKHNSLKK